MGKKKRGTQKAATMTEPVAVESTVDNLRENLEEIKTYEGVIGYILRNSTSATIDLQDPTKIIDYAILSSSSVDASQELSELFDLGDFKKIILEGKEVKILSLTIDENKVSIFTEKNVDQEKILKRIR